MTGKTYAYGFHRAERRMKAFMEVPEIDESIWERFREHTATESGLKAIWRDNERELRENPSLKACPDFEAFMRSLIRQIERMETGATMAQALAILSEVENENERG